MGPRVHVLGSYSSLDGEGEEILPLSLSGPHTDLLGIVSLNNYDGYNFYNKDSYVKMHMGLCLAQ